MSPCGDIYRLQSYVDGQLDEPETAALTAHLQQCAACARLVGGLRRVCLPLALPEAPAPAGLHERLLAAVAGVQPAPALDCHTALEYANLRLDGELSPEHCQQLSAHLDGCASCARAAGQLELTATLLGAVGTEAAPLGLLQRLHEAARPAPARRQAVPWLRRLAPGFGAVAAAAALLFMLVGRTPVPVSVAPQLAHQPVQTAADAREPVAGSARPTVLAATTPPARAATTTAPLRPRSRVSATVAFVAPVRPTRATHGKPVGPVPVAPVAAAAPAVPVAPTLEAVPVAVAVAPAFSGGPTDSTAPPSVPQLHTPAAESPVARLPELPAGARLAAAETGKSTPAVEVASTPTVSPRHRKTWVSRPSGEDREVYTADGDNSRLAEAREALRGHAETMRVNELRGFVIK